MENISSRCLTCNQSIPETLSAFLSTGTWHPEDWDEMFTSISGSPSQILISLECSGCSPWALCVGVHWPLLARPGQPTPALGKYSCWEHRAQLTNKRQQKRHNQPSGDMQEIFSGVFSKLKASVIVSYYCSNKSHCRDKRDLGASKNPS